MDWKLGKTFSMFGSPPIQSEIPVEAAPSVQGCFE